MTQYIGIVYDVIFLLLVLGAAEAGRRRGFASGLVSLIGSVAGIIGGTYGTRVWAGGIYDKYVASHVTDVVADTLEKTGGRSGPGNPCADLSAAVDPAKADRYRQCGVQQCGAAGG
ncbi:MAG: hypothetical protein ACLTZH_07125 [Subdoligranulum sp.]